MKTRKKKTVRTVAIVLLAVTTITTLLTIVIKLNTVTSVLNTVDMPHKELKQLYRTTLRKGDVVKRTIAKRKITVYKEWETDGYILEASREIRFPVLKKDKVIRFGGRGSFELVVTTPEGTKAHCVVLIKRYWKGSSHFLGISSEFGEASGPGTENLSNEQREDLNDVIFKEIYKKVTGKESKTTKIKDLEDLGIIAMQKVGLVYSDDDYWKGEWYKNGYIITCAQLISDEESTTHADTMTIETPDGYLITKLLASEEKLIVGPGMGTLTNKERGEIYEQKLMEVFNNLETYRE